MTRTPLPVRRSGAERSASSGRVRAILATLLLAVAAVATLGGCGRPYYVEGQDELGDLPDSLRVLIEERDARAGAVEKTGVRMVELGETPAEAELPLEYATEGPYLLRRGDKVQIDVMFYPELQTVTIVRPDGKVTAPGIGDVTALGRRPTEVAADIEAYYSRILRDPTTTINVLAFGERRAYVFGEVQRPGPLDLQQRMTLSQALASSGSPTEDAKLANVVLLRRRSENSARAYRLDLRGVLEGKSLAADVVLQPDDVIYVPEGFIPSMERFVDQMFGGLIPIPDLFIKSYDAIHVDERTALRRNVPTSTTVITQ